MTSFLLWLLALECGTLLFWGLLKSQRIYQFPFLAGAVFTGWVLPQLIGLSSNPFLPTGALEKTLFMTILCAGMCYVGYTWNRHPLRLLNWTFKDYRLLIGSAALSIIGAYFFFRVSQMGQEVTATAGGQWSGIITVYTFFSKLLTFGLIIALLGYLANSSKLALGVVLFDSVFYLDRIILKGRRAAMAEFMFIILFALWFRRGYVIPRWAMLAVILVGTLVTNSIGEYRGIVKDEEGLYWNKISEIDFIDNLRFLSSEGGHELTNTLYKIETVDRNLDFDFGLSLWNQLVFNYVPAQFLGSDFKRSLMVGEELDDSVYNEFYYTRATGTTSTGMTDAFASFWYFGALKFFLIAFIISKLYRAAIRGNFIAQFLSIVLMTPALHAITHSTNWFFKDWPQILVFVGPVLWLARTKRSSLNKLSRSFQSKGYG